MTEFVQSIVPYIPSPAIPIVVVVIVCFYLYNKFKVKFMELEKDRNKNKAERDEAIQQLRDNYRCGGTGTNSFRLEVNYVCKSFYN